MLKNCIHNALTCYPCSINKLYSIYVIQYLFCIKIVPIQLRVTGLPLHFAVKATNTENKQTVVHCILDTYDITPATGRFEAAHIYTSHPSKLSGTLIVIEDSPLVEEQYTGVGVGRGYYGDQSVQWYLFDLDKDPINKEGEGKT